jgi:hypothetical protein
MSFSRDSQQQQQQQTPDSRNTLHKQQQQQQQGQQGQQQDQPKSDLQDPQQQHAAQAQPSHVAPEVLSSSLQLGYLLSLKFYNQQARSLTPRRSYKFPLKTVWLSTLKLVQLKPKMLFERRGASQRPTIELFPPLALLLI